jgi:ribosomal protein S21
MTAFKKAVGEAGILNTYRQHEAYEKPGEKRAAQRRQAESARLKAKLKENFPRKSEKRRETNE